MKNCNTRHVTFFAAQGLVYYIAVSTRCETARKSPRERYDGLRVSGGILPLTVNLGIRGMSGADGPQRI